MDSNSPFNKTSGLKQSLRVSQDVCSRRRGGQQGLLRQRRGAAHHNPQSPPSRRRSCGTRAGGRCALNVASSPRSGKNDPRRRRISWTRRRTSRSPPGASPPSARNRSPWRSPPTCGYPSPEVDSRGDVSYDEVIDRISPLLDRQPQNPGSPRRVSSWKR